jgi:hypothetical protein
LTSKIKSTVSIGKRIIFILFNLFLMFILLFIGGEIFVRIKGHHPLKRSRPEILVEPGGKYFQKDKDLGYTHLPGVFKITLKKTYSFVTTHRQDTLRITHPVEQDSVYAPKEKIWILGCSVTHGWSVNDNETYSWLLQEKLPQYEVLNFGVSGYGTIHSLIQLQRALKTMPKPKLVILTYASFHDTRNTFSRLRRRIVSQWNFLGPVTQPYASLDPKGKLVIHHADRVAYTPWPLASISALVNYLEEKSIAHESVKIPHHAVSKALVKRIGKICKKESISLIVAGIKDNNRKMMKNLLNYCSKLGIPNVDISVDLDNKTYNNMPIDAHPNALAHRLYAEKLFSYLEEHRFLPLDSEAAPSEPEVETQ